MQKSQTTVLGVLLLLTLLLLAGCVGNQTPASEDKREPVTISVERDGGLLTGIGNVKVYIDGKEVMKVKNNQTKSVELLLTPGTHTIQTKGQGDKSSTVEFQVLTGEVNAFSFHTEISNVYGVSLERVR